MKTPATLARIVRSNQLSLGSAALLFLALLSLASPAAAEVPSCPEEQFVRRAVEPSTNDPLSSFSCNGQPYRFIGVNMPFLANLEEKVGGSAADERKAQLREAYAMGARVVRLFLPWNGRDAATAVSRLRAVLQDSLVESPEMRFIVALTDFYAVSSMNVTGDVTAGAYQAGGFQTLKPEWFTAVSPLACTSTTVSYSCFYEPFVSQVVPSFAGDWQIFAWELGNELAVPGPSVMLGFANDIGGKIKNTWLAQQMVTTGFISAFHATGGQTQGNGGGFLAALFGTGGVFDFATVHGYDDDFLSAPPASNAQDDDVAWLADPNNRTPYVVEEISFAGALWDDSLDECEEEGPTGAVTWARTGTTLFDATHNRSPDIKIMLNTFFDGQEADGFMQWGYNRGGFGALAAHPCYDMDWNGFLSTRGHVDWFDMNEAYNCKAMNLDASVTAADLLVVDVTPEAHPETHKIALEVGTPTSFVVTLYNAGRVALGSTVRVGVYTNPEDLPVASQRQLLSLAPGQLTTVTLTWTPQEGHQGVGELFFKVNDDSSVGGEWTCNNLFRQGVEMAACPTPTPTPAPSSAAAGLKQDVCLPPDGPPDLDPRPIQASATSLFAGNRVLFNTTVDNLGPGFAGPFTGRWLVDDEDTGVGASYVGLFPFGSVAAPEFPWTAVGGLHTIAFQVDPTGQVAEGSELNNLERRQVTVTPAARPDLLPTTIRFRAADLIEGQEVLFDSGVTNAGAAAAPPFTVLWRVDGRDLGIGAHAGVAAGATVLDGDSAFTWTAVAGTRTIEVLLDPGNFVDEVVETNNRRQVTVEVQPAVRPDLRPTAIRYDASSAFPGHPVLFDSGVSNLGLAGSGSFNVRWLVDGREVGAAGGHEGVPAGATVRDGNSELLWTLTSERQTITFEVDYDGQIGESNENNNRVTVTVGSTFSDIDLQPTTITYPVADLYAGHPVLFDSAVRNAGSEGTGPFNVRWTIDGLTTGFSGSHVGVPGGATVDNGNSQFVWTAVAGTHRLAFVVDADSHVDETNEGNNQRVITVVVPDAPRPDLRPTAIRFTAADLVAGGTVLFDSGVSNLGPGEAAPFNVAWRVDGLPVGSGSHGGVAAGATVLDGNSDFLWTATPGVHTITFAVDADNHLAETSEANNQVTVTITVANAPLADLRPTVIRFTAAELVGSNPVRFDAGVLNAGPGDAGPFNVRWLVDDVARTNGSHAGVPAATAVLDGNSEFLWTAEPGQHVIAFFVDSAGHVAETNEGNNQRQVVVQVAEPIILGPIGVPAATNIFAAGAGSSGGVGGGGVPGTLELPPGTGRVLTFGVSGGAISCCGTAGAHGADGGTGLSTFISSAGGISGVRHHSRNIFLMGVFLGDDGPAAAPPLRQYYDPADTASPPAGALSTRLAEYAAPALGQSFFIGDGLGEAGLTQRFRVPDGATRLFLGFADGLNLGHPGLGTPSPTVPGFYGDNTGTLSVTVRVVR